MLPIDEKAENCLLTSVISNKIFFDKGYFTQEYLKEVNKKAYHLYIFSDEEIKEGDWCYNSEDNVIGQVIEANKTIIQSSESINSFGFYMGQTEKKEYKVHQLKCDGFKNQSFINKSKKIIATTNIFLTSCCDCNKYSGEPEFQCTCEITNVPQPSQSFIEVFVREYNKGNIITDVDVEYEEVVEDEPFRTHLGFKLKINLDNTINIKPIKDSWSREEVVKLINKFEFDTFPNRYEGYGTEQDDINKWIEENL